MFLTPPPRLLVAQGAFLRSYPQRIPDGCRSRERKQSSRRPGDVREGPRDFQWLAKRLWMAHNRAMCAGRAPHLDGKFRGGRFSRGRPLITDEWKLR